MLTTYLEGEEAATVMFTLADQVDAMNEALLAERAEGEKKGAIKEAIKLYFDELNLLPAEITKRIMARFGLEQDVAEKYVEETLGLQLCDHS